MTCLKQLLKASSDELCIKDDITSLNSDTGLLIGQSSFGKIKIFKCLKTEVLELSNSFKRAKATFKKTLISFINTFF
jgi:hypothetical protein